MINSDAQLLKKVPGLDMLIFSPEFRPNVRFFSHIQ